MTTQQANNRRVIITRPVKQAGYTVAQLKSEGIDAVSIPSLVIEGVTDETKIRAIKSAVLALDEYSKLIFVSQNAVEFAFEWIEDYWPQWPSRLQCYSVGQKTHATLISFLNNYACAEDLAVTAKHQMNSEELLAMPQLREVSGDKILIFRGVGGRPKLGEVLAERGAQIDYCELYRRSAPPSLSESMIDHCVDPGSDILLVYSGESFDNFHQAYIHLFPETWSKLPVVAPSERVKNHIRDCGYLKVIAAKNASDAEMRVALNSLLKNENDI